MILRPHAQADVLQPFENPTTIAAGAGDNDTPSIRRAMSTSKAAAWRGSTA
jgi:hypothetical protein